ncbi:MAG: TolC family protein [Gemmatimonadota bacterium]|nr:TolC family protein [Gemmatimonadota bacterium]
MDKRFFQLTVSLFLGLTIAFAGVSRAMTLARAVAWSMDHNRDILSVKQQIAERQGQVIEARSDALPQIDLLATTNRLRNPGMLNSTFGQALLKGEGFGDEAPPIPIEALLPQPQTYYDLTLNFSQPLFTWGKVSNAVKLARLGIDDTDLSLEAIRNDVAYQVTSAYYDVLLAEEAIVTYEKAIETQARYLRRTRDFFELGDATRLDLLRAEAQLAATEPNLLEAKNGLVIAKKQLNFILGRPLDSAVSANQAEIEEDYRAPELEEVITSAMAKRPDLKRLNIQVEMYSKTISVFKADLRPRVDLRGYYGFSTIKTGNLFDRNYENWNIALEISVPIFDGFKNRGIIKQYKSQQARKEIETGKLAEQIRLEARQSVDACNSAAEVYHARRVSLASLEEEERVTADLSEQGLATLYELLDSNRRTLESKTDCLVARYGLLRQIAALKRVMGIPVDELF